MMNRRNFIGSAAAMGATAAAIGTGTAAVESKAGPLVKKNAVVLMQGDSITDAGRSREHADIVNDQKGMGKGYAWLVASQLLVERPADGMKFYNRGISGHKVPQLQARWQADCIDLKPDVLSILIGVNDIWHKINGNYQGTPESYEKEYLSLIEGTLKALPDVKLVICEPFVLRCGAINDKWFPQFDDYRAASKKVADTFGATFVPFQAIFDEASKIAPPEHWAGDGVHPSAHGSALMAHFWQKAVG